MARKEKSTSEPGRMKQMWQVFQMTRRLDSPAMWFMAIAFLLPVAAGIVLAIFATRGNVVGMVLYIVAGVLAGVLAMIIVLGRRAERAAYSQIQGQPGAVGAVLKNSLRRSWRASEMPVAVSARTQDAVYRAVGKGGVVLIGEGPRSRTNRMLDDERRKIARILPNVAINYLYVGPDEDSVPLHRIAKSLSQIKRSLNKAETIAVNNRLNSLASTALPIPKGIDPYKVRAPRPR